MKKPVQNVLARNSSRSIAYLCGKCGKEVEKDANVCIHCGAKLGKIKCPFCYFTGTVEDFKYDTCPKCGRKNINKNMTVKSRNFKKEFSCFSSKKFWTLFLVLTFSLMAVLFTIFFVYFR